MLVTMMARPSSRCCPCPVPSTARRGFTSPALHISCSSLPAIGCTRPEIENGKVAGSETTYNLEDTIIFECNFGYALKGSQESQCQFGGKWHPPVPSCEKRKCK